MKTLAKITLLAAGLAAAAVTVPVLHAADASGNNSATTGAPADKHPRLHALMRRPAVRQHLAQRLGLSADQVSQLKATRASTAAAVKAIRADASLTPEQKKAKTRETLAVARTQMRGVLTADQQAKLKQMRAALRKRVHARPAL